jgi:hypothetical protein
MKNTRVLKKLMLLLFTLSPANSNYLCITTVKEIFLVFPRTKTQSDIVLKILEANTYSLFVFPK